MNKDQVTGKVEQVAGRVKQGVGETLGNQNLANQGVADQVKGAAKETWGNVKDAAGVTADRHQKEAELQSERCSRSGFARRSTRFARTSTTRSMLTRRKSGTKPERPSLTWSLSS